MIKQAILMKHLSRRIANGHPYIYQNEIEEMKGEIEKGEIIHVFTFSGQFVGKGYYNPDSKIPIRLLTRSNETIDTLFVENKLKTAVAYRKKIFPSETVYRLFNGLSDGISGLSCDKYGDLYCVSSSTAGADKLQNWFIDALVGMGAQQILIRNTGASRLKEKIDILIKPVKGHISPSHRIELHSIPYILDPYSQEDPFFYLEQRQNAVLFAEIADKLIDLSTAKGYDFFSGYGQFGLNLAKAGLKQVEFVDTNGVYEDRIRQVGKEMPLSEIITSRCNAFDFLHRMDIENDKADLIILDPPPFTDSRKKKGRAINAYKEINLRALKILRKGGLLASSCPSQNVSREEMEMMYYSIASDIKHEVTILYRGGQSLDFPVKINAFETDFLKFFVLMKGDAV
ncbi:MAG TPA: hypothetical protein P5107_08560 [Thermotogota bacterium]|nr:hypothetical protein [Thermotogota bacterium]